MHLLCASIPPMSRLSSLPAMLSYDSKQAENGTLNRHRHCHHCRCHRLCGHRRCRQPCYHRQCHHHHCHPRGRHRCPQHFIVVVIIIVIVSLSSSSLSPCMVVVIIAIVVVVDCSIVSMRIRVKSLERLIEVYK